MPAHVPVLTSTHMSVHMSTRMSVQTHVSVHTHGALDDVHGCQTWHPYTCLHTCLYIRTVLTIMCMDARHGIYTLVRTRVSAHVHTCPYRRTLLKMMCMDARHGIHTHVCTRARAHVCARICAPTHTHVSIATGLRGMPPSSRDLPLAVPFVTRLGDSLAAF